MAKYGFVSFGSFGLNSVQQLDLLRFLGQIEERVKMIVHCQREVRSIPLYEIHQKPRRALLLPEYTSFCNRAVILLFRYLRTSSLFFASIILKNQ